MAGDEADPDGDGLPNLLEYATRGDPWAPSPPPLRQSSGSVRIAFNYRSGALDLRYVVQESSDLACWTDLFSFNSASGAVTINGDLHPVIDAAAEQIILSLRGERKPACFWRLVVHASP